MRKSGQGPSSFRDFQAPLCEEEQIQIPGSVQPHGMLFALRVSDFTILQVSANVFDHLGLHHDELLHQPLSQLMEIGPVEEAAKRLGEKLPRLLNPIPLGILSGGVRHEYDGILHRSGRTLILELEKHIPPEEGYGGFGGFYEAIREVASGLMSVPSLDEALLSTCDEVRKLTGFSRVLVYRFDDRWNGEVVAESKESGLSSLLHHRFPSTDIPRQARELYAVNWLRLIPNGEYTPSPLVPSFNPITDRPLDLSHSVLRSVSPVHLEYMRNMGQRASMSISLLHGKKLWGLISCHDESPRYLKFDTRVACEFIGQMLSAQISARDEEKGTSLSFHLRSLLAAALKSSTGLSGALDRFRDLGHHLLGLTGAQGVALCQGQKLSLLGVTPTEDELGPVLQHLGQREGFIYSTSEISEVLEASDEFMRKAAGVLSLRFPNGDFLLWFKPEMREQIPWGGNPHLSKEVGNSGQLHPRRSFETWLEDVRGRSEAWRSEEIDAAISLFDALVGMPRLPAAPSGERAVQDRAFRSALAKSMEETKSASDRPERVGNTTGAVDSMHEASQASRALLDGFDEFAIVFLDSAGRIQNWTAGAARLLGYQQSEILGNKLEILFSDDEVAREKHRRIIEYVEEHRRCEEEIWLYRKDRTSFWGKMMVAAVRHADSSLAGFSLVIQDITKEKAAEEELRATKLSAEAANQAKTAFLANISHEIRTPLGAVLGFAELLGGGNLSEPERVNLSERVQRNGVQLISLINDLLDLTKVESNKLDVEKIEFDLASLTFDIAETLAIKASEKSIQLKMEVVGRVPRFVVSDPTRLRQILVNLISNAVKFTPQGGKVTVTISLNSKGPQPRIVFHIEDTGRGMTEDQMAKLFQPFVQADVSTTRMFGGTGLGLFVSQRLARLLGGDVTIERSAPDQGSVFMVSVDLGAPDDESVFTEIANSYKHQPLNSLENSELRGVRILIVDDSPDNRHLLNLYLTKAGAELESAENGREGVQKALSGQFDVVLMDIQMPILDGKDAMRTLKQLGYSKPVVALTAHAMNEERESSLNLGFRSYLTKPIQRDALVRTIRELFDAS